MSTMKIKWAVDATGASVLRSNGARCGRVYATGIKGWFAAEVYVGGKNFRIDYSPDRLQASSAVEQFWRDAATTVWDLGL